MVFRSKIQTLKERVPFPSGCLDSKKQQASWKHHLVIWSSLTYTNHPWDISSLTKPKLRSAHFALEIARNRSRSGVEGAHSQWRIQQWDSYNTGTGCCQCPAADTKGSAKKTHVQWPAEIQIIYVNTCHSLSLFELRACCTQEQMRNWTIWVPT